MWFCVRTMGGSNIFHYKHSWKYLLLCLRSHTNWLHLNDYDFSHWCVFPTVYKANLIRQTRAWAPNLGVRRLWDLAPELRRRPRDPLRVKLHGRISGWTSGAPKAGTRLPSRQGAAHPPRPIPCPRSHPCPAVSSARCASPQIWWAPRTVSQTPTHARSAAPRCVTSVASTLTRISPR